MSGYRQLWRCGFFGLLFDVPWGWALWPGVCYLSCGHSRARFLLRPFVVRAWTRVAPVCGAREWDAQLPPATTPSTFTLVFTDDTSRAGINTRFVCKLDNHSE